MKNLKFRTPVICQNGHKAFWYWKPDNRDIGEGTSVGLGVPEELNCECSKFELGEGWRRNGDDQLYTGFNDIKGKEVFEGDFIKKVASNHSKFSGLFEIKWIRAGFYIMVGKVPVSFGIKIARCSEIIKNNYL